MKICEKKYVDDKDLSSFGAFSCDDKVLFKLLVPRRHGVVSVFMHLCGEGLENHYYKRVAFNWESIDGANDVYTCLIDLADIGVGLYYYKYEINSTICEFYGEGNGISEISKMSNENDGMIQLLIHQEKGCLAEWMYGGIMYHIFVDRFRKSGRCKPKKNVVINDDWYNGIPQFADVPGGYVENNMFFGGDLYGIIEKLDYIKSLGVTCLYLSPIFDAYSNHKYDTGDYMSVDSMFGSEEALDELIKAVKGRGMHIIFDGVFNHTGADSIYFNKFGNYDSVGAYQTKNSAFYEWYNFRDYPNDYECWWNVKILPRVNSNCPSYQRFILGEGGVIDKWMKKGIDGWRLDVADELSDDFLRTLNQRVKSVKPDGIVYGEVWEDASNKIAYGQRKKYFLGNELDSVMNYPLREAVIEYIKYGNSENFYKTCKMLYSHYPKHNADLLMNLLGTHDTVRILTALGGENGDNLTNKELSRKRMTSIEKKKAVKLLKLSYAIIATVPGVPCIYYGDEVGMEGYRDPFNRLPFPWGRKDKELLEFYRKIGELRTGEDVYKTGSFKIIECNSEMLAFSRYDKEGFVITVINRSEEKFYLNSNVLLKNCLTGKSVNVIQPATAYFLKCKSNFEHAKIEFNR